MLAPFQVHTNNEQVGINLPVNKWVPTCSVPTWYWTSSVDWHEQLFRTRPEQGPTNWFRSSGTIWFQKLFEQEGTSCSNNLYANHLFTYKPGSNNGSMCSGTNVRNSGSNKRYKFVGKPHEQDVFRNQLVAEQAEQTCTNKLVHVVQEQFRYGTRLYHVVLPAGNNTNKKAPRAPPPLPLHQRTPPNARVKIEGSCPRRPSA